MVQFGALIVVLIGGLGASAFADTTTMATKLGPLVNDLKIEPGADFRHRSLLGSTFVDCDFSAAKFDGANLGGAVFIECDFSNASFRDALFCACVIANCSFSGSDLTNSVISYIKPASGYTHADVYLSPKQLRSTRSWKAKDLRGYAFPRGSLGESTSLDGYDLRDGVLVGGDFYSRYDCDLSGLDLAAANVILTKGAKLKLDDARVRDCILQFSSHLATESLQASQSYRERILRNVTLRNANLDSLALDRFMLQNVRFSGCDLNQVTFSEAAFVSVTISRCTSFDLSQLNESWNKAVEMMHLINIQ